MADSVKFIINIKKNIDDKELKKIKKELRAEIKKKKKKPAKKDSSKSKTPEAQFFSNVDKQEKKIRQKKVKPKLTSSSSPIAPPEEQREGGGIYGRTDPGVKGFQKRKGILGGVQKQRDDRSKAAHSQKFFREMIGDIKKDIKTNTVSSKAIEGIIKNHMADFVKGSQILTNPQGFVGKELLKNMKGVGAVAGPIGAAITAIIVSVEVMEQVIKLLSQKGLPLNRDWQRSIEEEVNGLFSIEDKKKRLLGIDSFIVTQTNTFEPESGSTTHNSLENRDEIIISKIGLAEKAVGVTK